MAKAKGKKGFRYTANKKQINEYRKWPIERRLNWLLKANKLRKFLPPNTIKIQEAFREGKL
jgi:hypothetical protein